MKPGRRPHPDGPTKQFCFQVTRSLAPKIRLLVDLGPGMAPRFIREAVEEKWQREGLDRIADLKFLVRRLYEILPEAQRQAERAVDEVNATHPEGPRMSLEKILELKVLAPRPPAPEEEVP